MEEIFTTTYTFLIFSSVFSILTFFLKVWKFELKKIDLEHLAEQRHNLRPSNHGRFHAQATEPLCPFGQTRIRYLPWRIFAKPRNEINSWLYGYDPFLQKATVDLEGSFTVSVIFISFFAFFWWNQKSGVVQIEKTLWLDTKNEKETKPTKLTQHGITNLVWSLNRKKLFGSVLAVRKRIHSDLT